VNINTDTALVPGSITAMATTDGVLAAPEIVVYADISSSMEAMDAVSVLGGACSRHQAVNEQLAILQRKFPGKIAVIAFGSRAEFCPNGQLPDAYGLTNLHEALEMGKEIDGAGIWHIVLSDGDPDQPYECWDLARSITGRIDTILIAGQRRGEDFLRELAKIGRGEFMRDASGLKLLAQRIVGLLGDSQHPIVTETAE